MSKYFKSYSLISSSCSATQQSIESVKHTADNDVDKISTPTTQITIDGYTQSDISLFDQLTPNQYATPITASAPARLAAQQEYTNQDMDKFDYLVKSIQPSPDS